MGTAAKILLFLFLFQACSPSVKFTRHETKPPVSSIEESKTTEHAVDVYTGLASYYADDFNGKLTANGEIYDMYGLTAAHPNFPFGTEIKVTNLTNNKSAVIRVNDRMPQHRTRMIDLSLGTAKALDMLDDGVVEVKLEILKWGEGK